MKYKLFIIGIVIMLVMSGLVLADGDSVDTSEASNEGQGLSLSDFSFRSGSKSTEGYMLFPNGLTAIRGLENYLCDNEGGEHNTGTKCGDILTTNCWTIADNGKFMWTEDDGNVREATVDDSILSDYYFSEGGSYDKETGLITTSKGDVIHPDGIVVKKDGLVKVYEEDGSFHDLGKLDSASDTIQGIDVSGDGDLHIIAGDKENPTHYLSPKDHSEGAVSSDYLDGIQLTDQQYQAVDEFIDGQGIDHIGDGVIVLSDADDDPNNNPKVKVSDGISSPLEVTYTNAKGETTRKLTFDDGSEIFEDEKGNAVFSSNEFGDTVRGDLSVGSDGTITVTGSSKSVTIKDNGDETTTQEYRKGGETLQTVTCTAGCDEYHVVDYKNGNADLSYWKVDDKQYESKDISDSGGSYDVYIYDETGGVVGYVPSTSDITNTGIPSSIDFGYYTYDKDNDKFYLVTDAQGGKNEVFYNNLPHNQQSDLDTLKRKTLSESRWDFASGMVLNRKDLSAFSSLIFSQWDGYQDFVTKIDNWFSSSVLNFESSATSALCYWWFFDSPQDLASDGVAVIENSYGNPQQIAMINAEVTESDALLCSLEFDEDDEGEYSCPEGLECNEDDGFCYNEDDEKAHGYFYKVTWGMSAPADEALTPEVREGSLPVEYNVWLRSSKGDGDINFYESGSETKCPLKLSNGESDGAVITWWSDKDYTGDEVCILWDEKCGSKIYTAGGHAMATKPFGSQVDFNGVEIPDLCNPIVKAKTGTVQLTNPNGYSLSTKSSNSVNDVDTSDDDIEVNYP